MAAVHALYDLCSMPSYIDDLRAELKKSKQLTEIGWTFDTIKSLRKLDSFLKESLRFNQPDACKFYISLLAASSEIGSGLEQDRGLLSEAFGRNGDSIRHFH